MQNWKPVLITVFIYTLAFALFSFRVSAQEGEAEKTEKKPTPKAAKRFSKIYAKFETTEGDFKVLLHHAYAPKTVENFVGLAEGTKEWTDEKRKRVKKPFYDGLTFHRVVKGFVIQGGDPQGTGFGGPGNPPLKDEIHPNLTHDKVGVVSMANSGPDTSGSQFFITLKPQPSLDGKYSIFGEVVEGMDVVQKIGNVPVDIANSKPRKDVIMKKVTIERE